MDGIKDFYVNLYASKQTLDPCILLNSEKLRNLPTLNDTERRTTEAGITLADLKKALECFKPNKSPGVDGLNAEFYKVFWNEIGPKLFETLQYSIQTGELPLSQRRAIITLLPKLNKDPLLIKSYRPVSLINCDYKILSKAICNKIAPFLDKLISFDQLGCIQNRFIGQNIRIIDDILEYTDTNMIKAIIVQLDFEKAFDSIEWSFLLQTLHKYNFGDNVIRLVKLCYNNIFSTVLNNGYSTGWFQLFRGVRQGCPLSAALFTLCVEILAHIIRNTAEIKGLKIGLQEKKILQFADDTSCIMMNPESIQQLFTLTDTFSTYSGLSLNKDKSQLIWLGPWKNKNYSLYNLNLQTDCFTMLGISLGYNKTLSQTKFHYKSGENANANEHLETKASYDNWKNTSCKNTRYFKPNLLNEQSVTKPRDFKQITDCY